MQTLKRAPFTVDTAATKNISKATSYFNHFDFKGIMQDKNVFDIDQESFYDATNMYVDDERKLVSRPTLQEDTLPTVIENYLNAGNGNYIIDDVVPTAAGDVYAMKHKTNETFTIIFVPKNYTPVSWTNFKIENVTKYHIAIIEHYIICFNNVDAKVIDTNSISTGWQDFDKFVEIPVIKRVIGSTTTELEKNNFTASYKEEYIWSNSSHPILPENNKETDVVVNTESEKLKYVLTSAHIATDYRILRRNLINTVNDEYLVSIKNDIMCIAKDGYFLISYNAGRTFSTIYYPDYDTFLNIASISEDGKYFYFVASNGVYRYDIGNNEWELDIPVNNINGDISKTGYYNMCYFKNEDTYCFITYDGTDANIYYRGPGLYLTDVSYSGKLIELTNSGLQLIDIENVTGDSYITAAEKQQLFIDALRDSISIYYNVNQLNNRDTTISILSYPDQTTPNRRVFIINKNNYTGIIFNNTDYLYLHIKSSSTYTPTQNATFSIGATLGILCYNTMESKWEVNNFVAEDKIVGGVGTQSVTYISSLETVPYPTTSSLQSIYNKHTPYKLAGGYICYTMVYSNIDAKWILIDGTLLESYICNIIETATNKIVWTNGDYYYILINNSYLYTNKLADNDIATITYTYKAISDKFTEVPNVSYSDTELYLAFDNKLCITQNGRDGTNILFNLPTINDQYFIDNITGMINISTTEVALFFLDKIVICSKVQDENMDAGYRYDYYNTKLSTGIRLGDSVINTLEGSYTIFPTRRGLSVMNYQAFMATTDQVIEYITDDIKEIWTNFYDTSSKIYIMQWRNHIVLTNQTGEVLLYNLQYKAWWKWQLPVTVFKMLTDQIHLMSIHETRLIFKESVNYYDFSEVGRPVTIDYMLMSQPLHFKASNYYKNIKQLVFQFGTDDEESDQIRTLLAQIKLYRKKVTVREPEVMNFKVDQLRTFVKRFNYWKINELQWALANDTETSMPNKLELNGISIKYEYGEEVR